MADEAVNIIPGERPTQQERLTYNRVTLHEGESRFAEKVLTAVKTGDVGEFVRGVHNFVIMSAEESPNHSEGMVSLTSLALSALSGIDQPTPEQDSIGRMTEMMFARSIGDLQAERGRLQGK